MSDKKTGANDIGLVQPESSPSKGLLKKKDAGGSPSKKSVTFEDPRASAAASPPKQALGAEDGAQESKDSGAPKKYKNLLITIQRVECLYSGSYGGLDTADPQVSITFNGVTCKTTEVANNTKPFYQETFSFLVEEENWASWKQGKKDPKSIKNGEKQGFLKLQIEENDVFQAGSLIRGQREGSLKTMLGKTDGRGVQSLELYELEIEGAKPISDGGPSKTAAARVVLGWTISDVDPATHLGSEEQGGAYPNCKPDDFRNASGVLIATVHQVGGFPEGSSKYVVIAELAKIKDGKKTPAPQAAPASQRCELDHFQAKSAKLYLDSERLLEEELSFYVCQIGAKPQPIKGGVFRQRLTHALSLVDGEISTVMIEAEEPHTQKNAGARPTLVVTLSYLNSIYTRFKGEGMMTLTITSWTKGPQEALIKTHATLKLYQDDGKEVSPDTWAVSEPKNAKGKRQLQQSEPVELNLPGGALQKLELSLLKQADGPFAGFRGATELAKVDLCIAELFGNARIPQLVERYFANEKVDNKNECLIKISYSAKFDPKNATQDDRDEWARNAKLGAGAVRQRSRATQLVTEKQDTPIDVVSETKLSPFDYQARDLFDLALPDAPLFADQPKGVIVLQLQGLGIRWDPNVYRSLFMLISSGKEIHRTKSVACGGADQLHWGNEIVKLNTGDRGDQIFFKLYDDADTSVVLAEGKLSLQMILVDTRAFKTAKACMSFQVFEQSWETPLSVADEDRSKLGDLNVSLMYRCSELTKEPRGRLELSLKEGFGLTYLSAERESTECQPAVEFILNNQRVLVKSKLLEAVKNGKRTQARAWEANRVCIDTFTTLDVLQINFYDDQDGSLLGCEYRDVSALWLTNKSPEVAARKKSKETKNQNEIENIINIDLRRLPHLKGFITISCRFLPRKTPSQKLDIRHKLRETMLAEQLKSSGGSATKDIKKDACTSMLRSTSGLALNNQVSYISIDLIQLKNIDASKALLLRHIVVELAYGKNKYVSRCTLDLGQTRNQECLDNFFRVNLKDLSLRARDDPDFSVFDDHDIIVTAYSVVQNAAKKDIMVQGAEAGNKVKIGQCRLQSALLRQAQNTDLRVNCGIGIPGDFYTGVEQSPGAGDEAYEQEELDAVNGGQAKVVQEEDDFKDDELEQQASGLLSRMGQDLRAMEAMSRKAGSSKNEQSPTDAMVVLKVSIFTAQSRIIRSPIGILSLSNFKLYNSGPCLGDFNLLNPSNSLVVKVESNGIHHTSGSAEETSVANVNSDGQAASSSEIPPDKDYCLKGSDGQILKSFFREGKAFYLNHAFEDVQEFETLSAKDSAKVLRWPAPAMFNMFCSQALNEVELSLVLQNSQTSSSQVISRAELNLADVSLFMDAGAENESLNLAFEMDCPQFSVRGKGPDARASSRYDLVGFAHEEQTPATNFKNLLGHYYDNKLIFTMQVNFNSEIVREARQLGAALRGHPKTISCLQNAFLMPQQVKYKDFIANGYDELVKKQTNLKKQEKAARRGNLGGGMASESKKDVPNHLLVDFKFKSLESLLKNQSMGATSGFLAYEPIHDVKTAIISDYLATVEEQAGEGGDLKVLQEQRAHTIRKNLGDLVDSLIVSPQNLLPPSIQMSKIFAFSGLQSQTINENLQCWVNSGVSKVVLSFISQRSKSSEIHDFREHLSQQPVMQAHNILGIVQAYNKKLPSAALDQPDQQIMISQAVIDLDGALDYEKKAPDGSYMRAQSSSQICQKIALRSLKESVGDELDSQVAKTPTASLSTLVSRVSTSAFIDCPSGDVDVIIKRLSTNQKTIHSPQHCIRVQMISPVAKEKILVDVSGKADQAETAAMSQYSNKPSPEDGFNNVLVNHVTNLVSRHFMDKIRVQVIQKGSVVGPDVGTLPAEKALFTTTIELNKLPIKHKEVLSFTVMATGAQSLKSKQPIYYKIEMDLIYKSRDGSSGGMGLLEQAIENYKLMMGKDSLTDVEIEILKMLIERQQLGTKLDWTRLKMRKAGFFVRRLSKLQYRTLDNKKGLTMLVSPLTFLYKVFSSSTFGRSYDHYRVLDLKQRVEKELQSCKPLAPGLKDALERAKRSSGVENDDFINFKEGNLLQVDFPSEGLDLVAYGIKSLSLKKLVFIIQLCQGGKPSKTVFTKEFFQKQLEKADRVLQGQQVFIPNVNAGVEVKIAIMVVPQADPEGVQSKKAEILRAHGQPASLFLNEYVDKLKNNQPISVTLPLCKQQLPIAFRVVQNALTRQPHRVIEITFHRLMRLEEVDFVTKEQLALAAVKSQQSGGSEQRQGAGKGTSSAPNNINLVLAEKECVVNENEVMRAEELAALEGEEEESTEASSAAKGEQISKGSINDAIQKTAAKEADSTKYDLFLDFDTCEPFLGVHKGSHKIDINKFGKAQGKGINKFEINNTSASNKIKFKLFRHDSRQSHRLRQFGIGMEAGNQGELGGADKVEVGQLAEAEINLSHLNNFYINQAQGFVCPVQPTAAEDLDFKSAGHKVEGVFALFAIKITDKTFGELVLDLNEFRGLPACPAVEQLSWRVLIKPTVAGATANRIRREAEEAEISFDEVKKKKIAVKSDLDSVGRERIPPTFEQRADPPIKYNMATMGGAQSRLTLTREMVIGIKMKDIFSNKSLFMRGGNELYAEFDQRIFIELFAATKAGTQKSLIGQLEMNLVDLIRKSIQQEDSKASELRRQKARDEQEASKKLDVQEEEAVSGKSQALELEQAQRVEKAQRGKQRGVQHRQEMRELKKKVKAGEASPEDLKAKEDAFEAEQEAGHKQEAEQKREESDAASAASGKGKSRFGSAFGSAAGSNRGGPRSNGGESTFGDEDPCKEQIPQGFKSVILPNVDKNGNEDEELDYLTGDLRLDQLSKKSHATRLVYKSQWQFSFQKRELRTEAYYANLADLQELERTRERKKIPNMIEALYLFAGEFSGDSAAASRLTDTMTVLSLVLASESANKAEGMEALENHQLLKNVQELLMAFGSVFIRFQAATKGDGKPPGLELGSAKPIKKVEMPVVPSTVALMRCSLYIKIICKNAAPKYLKRFQAGFEKARLFPHIIEIFEKKGKTSRQLATKTLQFVTYMIYDLPELYFSSISGVRLTPLIEHVNNSEENRKDAELIALHSKLVNACCQCLFQFEPSGEKAAIQEQIAIVKHDTKRLGENIYSLVCRLIGGEMNSQFKKSFEDIAMPLCDSAIRFIHLSIRKFDILNSCEEDKKDTTLSLIFEALFQILVDAIASGLSMDFIDKIKKLLNYEIQLISQLNIRNQLNLLFNGGIIQSRLKKLLDIYLENQQYNKKFAAGLIDETEAPQQDMDQYLATAKPILEFFADEDAMNTLGENNSKQIREIMKDPAVSNSSDFCRFLNDVIKADMENEDSVKGEGDQTRKHRIKKEKYGGIVNINRFSISHIEWLADQMPELIDI